MGAAVADVVGLRMKHVSIAELVGFRRGFDALREDVAAAAVFWVGGIRCAGDDWAGAAKRQRLSAPQKTLMAIAPQYAAGGVALGDAQQSAGFCEEFVFRGYLLQQFASSWAQDCGLVVVVLLAALRRASWIRRRGGMIAITAYGAMFCVLAIHAKESAPRNDGARVARHFHRIVLMLLRTFSSAVKLNCAIERR